MGKSVQLHDNNSENIYPHPYWPIGSIYLSIVNTNPSTWFGGTWEQIAKGRTLVGVDTNDTDFNTVQKTGGSKTHRHLSPLTWISSPNHSDWGSFIGTTNSLGYKSLGTNSRDFYGMKYTKNIAKGDSNWPEVLGYYTDIQNHMPPYFTCYIWCRTA